MGEIKQKTTLSPKFYGPNVRRVKCSARQFSFFGCRNLYKIANSSIDFAHIMFFTYPIPACSFIINKKVMQECYLSCFSLFIIQDS